LKDKLAEFNLNLGSIRPCRWRASCYEFDAAIKDKAHMVVTIGPKIPLIAEYRRGLQLFERIKGYINTTYQIESGAKTVQVDNWMDLIDRVKKESFRGSNLQRYKGLGEMNPDQLWETTMNPEKRTLLKVNIEDVESADDIFTTLMGDKVEPRREFIQNHALEVTDLDI